MISYYAVGNSLDGQPMVDMVNVLRFFPVFAMRDDIDTVKVTIYYGGFIYKGNAEKMEDGGYWQALLPKFRLGEAIQRLEVEVHFKIPSQFKVVFKEINEMDSVTTGVSDMLKGSTDNLVSQLTSSERAFQMDKKVEYGVAVKASNDKFSTYGFNSKDANNLRVGYEANPDTLDELLDTYKIKILGDEKSDPKAVRDGVKKLVVDREKAYKTYLTSYSEFHSTRMSMLSQIDSIEVVKQQRQAAAARYRDSVFAIFSKYLEVQLTDTMYTGPSVRRSDLVIDPDDMGAKILYRNYKTSLRRLMALDPAERMGIFRVRYVPFPVTGSTRSTEMTLKRPMTAGSPVVFEVGLAFGDAIVSGDDFALTEFSAARLGIAFAITEQLFSDSAQVLALALTYDFNSYGSIGFGANFAGGGRPSGYASLGINKKAFEALIGQISKVFH